MRQRWHKRLLEVPLPAKQLWAVEKWRVYADNDDNPLRLFRSAVSLLLPR